MGNIITIAQSLLDGLKWLMEGSNWLFLTPVLLISGYIMVQMAKKRETFLIFIWYLATIAIASLMIELAWGGWEALIFAAIFIVLYLFICIPHFLRRLHVVKKGKHAAPLRPTRNQIKERKTRS